MRQETKEEERKKLSQQLTFFSSMSIAVAVAVYFFTRELMTSLISMVAATIILMANSYFRKKLKQSARIKKMEEIFPDFLQLMSSNLRAGITIDRAMLLSAREEFFPLDKEILKTGRDITTGKNIEDSLLAMSKRIDSPKISKTILLLISGIKSGGDVATLLEETASNMREKAFLEKKASSSVLMYVIFIFVAVAVAAPALFGLSNLLVDILSTLLAEVPTTQSANMPFTMSSVSISTTFIFYFSLTFIIVIDILAALILGLVSKGEEKQGIKYLVPMVIISLIIFFAVKFGLSGFVKGMFP